LETSQKAQAQTLKNVAVNLHLSSVRLEFASARELYPTAPGQIEICASRDMLGGT
jgi:hypothetical protein